MIANAQPSRDRLCQRRDAWNQRYKLGTFVRYWDATNPQQWLIAPTTAAAFVHGNSVVVYVRGRRLPVALSNLEVLTASALFAILHPRQVQPVKQRPGRERAMPVGDRGE